MSSSPEPSRPRRGCFMRLISAIFLLGLVALIVAAVYAFLPDDLSDVSGIEEPPRPPVRNLSEVIKSSLQRGYPITLSEAEINRWLAHTVTATQGGLLDDYVKFDRVMVRLHEGVAEVIMVRSIRDRPWTVSMFLTLEQVQTERGKQTKVHLHGGPYHPDFLRPTRGGKIGRLVVPQGFLLLVLPAYQKLSSLFPTEIRDAFQEMAQIRIEEDRLMLDPRGTEEESSSLPGSF